MSLLTVGYWPETAFPESYWPQDYWPEYGEGDPAGSFTEEISFNSLITKSIAFNSLITKEITFNSPLGES